MNSPEPVHPETADRIQRRIVDYGLGLSFERLTPEAVHAAKVRILDTVGALLGGFFDEPSHLARSMVRDCTGADTATVLGTRQKTTLEMAAFANGITARSVEINDIAHKPGGRNGHPSDVLMPLYSIAESMRHDGREYITASVIAYEVYLRIAQEIQAAGFDLTTFGCLSTAAGAARLLGLDAPRYGHAMAIAATSGNALNQIRVAPLTMWKAVASGESSRAGVFSALLARAGIEGPSNAFEGKRGWCVNVAGKSIELAAMGGEGVPYKVEETLLKPRAACFLTLPHILAAEKAGAKLGGRIDNVASVTVETYEQSRAHCGVGEVWWNPQTRDTADHSIPYTVAVALMYGKVDQHSFDDRRLWDPALRTLLAKVAVVEEPEFTRLYGEIPVLHCTRVIVKLASGETVVGESGGSHSDLSDAWSDDEVSEKFRSLADPVLGDKRAAEVLKRLWSLESLDDVSVIAPMISLV